MDKYYFDIPRCVQDKMIFDVELLQDIKDKLHYGNRKLKDLTMEELEDIMKIFHVCPELRRKISDNVKVNIERYTIKGKRCSLRMRTVFHIRELVKYAHNPKEVDKFNTPIIDAWAGYSGKGFKLRY